MFEHLAAISGLLGCASGVLRDIFVACSLSLPTPAVFHLSLLMRDCHHHQQLSSCSAMLYVLGFLTFLANLRFRVLIFTVLIGDSFKGLRPSLSSSFAMLPLAFAQLTAFGLNFPLQHIFSCLCSLGQ